MVSRGKVCYFLTLQQEKTFQLFLAHLHLTETAHEASLQLTDTKTRQNYKLTLTKESKVPSSMSLAAFLSPRANESIAPSNIKEYLIVDDLQE